MMQDAAGVVADIPRLFTGTAEWGACLVFLLIVRRRWSWPATIAIMVGGFGALVGVQFWAGTLPLSLWIPGMLGAAGTMYVLLFASLRVSAVTAGYLTARTFVLAELVASLHWQLDRFYWSSAEPVTQTVLFATVYVVLLMLAWLAERRHLPQGAHLVVGWGEVVSALAIAAATFGISNLSFVTAGTPFSGRLGPEIFYIRTLVDLCGFIALYVQQQQRREAEERRANESMETLLRTQHDQYLISRRAMEEVDRKYHDMKHHLDAIRAEQDPQLKMRILDDLEVSIRDYGSQVRSGNSVLDAVLTAKQMYAREQGIQVTSVAAGKLIDFMSPLDVTAIVGNALDNAFEATSRLTPADRRMVKFSLFAHDDFVMLRFENTYDGVVRRRGGVIVTRKAGDSHGYGLRNIESAAEKYGGSVSISHDGEWFSLRVLLPQPPASAGDAS